MSVTVFARTPRALGVARMTQIAVHEFVAGCTSHPPTHARRLSQGEAFFIEGFPVALRATLGVHFVEQHVDVDQLKHAVWLELWRLWRVMHPAYSPQTFLDAEEAYAIATAAAPPLGDQELSIVSGSDNDVHDQIFEGSARERKGKIDDLGIKPDATGRIMSDKALSVAQSKR